MLGLKKFWLARAISQARKAWHVSEIYYREWMWGGSDRFLLMLKLHCLPRPFLTRLTGTEFRKKALLPSLWSHNGETPDCA
jgi:hypothetical protein